MKQSPGLRTASTRAVYASSLHIVASGAWWSALAVICAMFLAVTTADARVEIVEFETDSQRRLYQDMIAELRCLVCQNQNLADSNADLARDLRQRTRDLILQGKTRDEIAEFMVARYGDFVLYRPPLKASTLVLWFAPFALFCFMALYLFRRFRRSQQSQFDSKNVPTSYSSDELDTAASLLQKDLPDARK
ncbi:MAG: cytochrome c-type biogenesis protein [Pseudomonadota bacterium]